MTTTEAPSGLTIELLGATVRAHLNSGDRHLGKYEEHYKSAGQHLIEGKRRIAAGEYLGKFGMWLQFECKGLQESRAYELIAIASGTKTAEETRQRHKDYRQACKDRDEAVRSQAESTESQSDQPLSGENPGNPPPKPKVGRPATPKTPEAHLRARIAKALQALDVGQLETVLTLIRTL